MGIEPLITTGDIFYHPKYGEYEVISYTNSKSVTIRFKRSGNIVIRESGDIRKLCVKDTEQPSVYGVGILGDIGTSYRGKRRLSYTFWTRMLKRCYCEKYHKVHPTYRDCEVCEEWQYYPNFHQWFEENHIRGYDLDKDIKIDGNRVYSPETCLFVTREENTRKSNEKCMYISKVVDPNGNLHVVQNQRQFSNQNKLTPSGLNGLIKGRYKTYRGWRLYED